MKKLPSFEPEPEPPSEPRDPRPLEPEPPPREPRDPRPLLESEEPELPPPREPKEPRPLEPDPPPRDPSEPSPLPELEEPLRVPKPPRLPKEPRPLLPEEEEEEEAEEVEDGEALAVEEPLSLLPEEEEDEDPLPPLVLETMNCAPSSQSPLLRREIGLANVSYWEGPEGGGKEDSPSVSQMRRRNGKRARLAHAVARRAVALDLALVQTAGGLARRVAVDNSSGNVVRAHVAAGNGVGDDESALRVAAQRDLGVWAGREGLLDEVRHDGAALAAHQGVAADRGFVVDALDCDAVVAQLGLEGGGEGGSDAGAEVLRYWLVF